MGTHQLLLVLTTSLTTCTHCLQTTPFQTPESPTYKGSILVSDASSESRSATTSRSLSTTTTFITSPPTNLNPIHSYDDDLGGDTTFPLLSNTDFDDDITTETDRTRSRTRTRISNTTNTTNNNNRTPSLTETPMFLSKSSFTPKEETWLKVLMCVFETILFIMWILSVHQCCVTNYHYDQIKLRQRCLSGFTIFLFLTLNLTAYLNTLLPKESLSSKHCIPLNVLYIGSELIAAWAGIHAFHRLLNSHVRLLYDTMSIVPPAWFHVHWILEMVMYGITLLCHALYLIMKYSNGTNSSDDGGGDGTNNNDGDHNGNGNHNDSHSNNACDSINDHKDTTSTEIALYVFFVAVGLELLCISLLLITLMRKPKALLDSLPLTNENRMEITIAKHRVRGAMFMAIVLLLVSLLIIIFTILWMPVRGHDGKPLVGFMFTAERQEMAININLSIILMALSVELLLWIYKDEGLVGSEESICCLLCGCSCGPERGLFNSDDNDQYKKLPIMLDQAGGATNGHHGGGHGGNGNGDDEHGNGGGHGHHHGGGGHANGQMANGMMNGQMANGQEVLLNFKPIGNRDKMKYRGDDDDDDDDDHFMDGAESHLTLEQQVQKSSGEQKGPETTVTKTAREHKTTVTDMDLLSSVTDLRSSHLLNQHTLNSDLP